MVYGHDGLRDLVPVTAERLAALGYARVHLLDGGITGRRQAGSEIFIDVNVPSKAFGELVENRRQTPLMPAEQVRSLLDAGGDAVVLDARRFDEYQTMSIPGGISVPGAELVLRLGEIAPDPATMVIVNCAGRTRSIIGTQSLINAGVPNRVVGLRNGTIGWTLAGQRLDHGADRRFPEVGSPRREAAARAARAVAERAGVRRIDHADLAGLQDPGRTTYLVDVRTEAEFLAGHLPGFANAPGGQLVQETDHTEPVRGARFVLADDDGTRADMTASWLAQMGWQVLVLDPVAAILRAETGPAPDLAAAPPPVATIDPAELDRALKGSDAAGLRVLDVTSGANYVRGHIPGAFFVLRSQIADALGRIGPAERYVFTCSTDRLARFAAADLAALSGAPVEVLLGGTNAWRAAGLPLAQGEERLASPRIDRYRRPYEGTDAPVVAMEAYLEWEYGLVAQLGRDGTHFFNVI